MVRRMKVVCKTAKRQSPGFIVVINVLLSFVVAGIILPCAQIAGPGSTAFGVSHQQGPPLSKELFSGSLMNFFCSNKIRHWRFIHLKILCHESN